MGSVFGSPSAQAVNSGYGRRLRDGSATCRVFRRAGIADLPRAFSLGGITTGCN